MTCGVAMAETAVIAKGLAQRDTDKRLARPNQTRKYTVLGPQLIYM